MRTHRTGRGTLSVALSLLAFATPATALASSGLDSPENGIAQLGRGSAWVARADDPLAVYFNPATLAFQATGVHLGVDLISIGRCYTRLGTDGKPVSPGQGIEGPGAPGGPPGEICNSSLTPNPQLGATFRITSKFAVGVAVVPPHSAGGNNWPESIKWDGREAPAPTRYLLVSSDALIVNTAFSVSYAPLDNLSFGAGFVWGFASAKFSNFAEALSPEFPKGALKTDDFFLRQDIRADISIQDVFIPGFVLGGFWAPSENLDLGAWFKWQDELNAAPDLHVESTYWDSTGLRAKNPCPPATPKCNITDRKSTGEVRLPIPMEAKLGTRFHVPRKGGPKPEWTKRADGGKVRDPMSEDVFDVELDFTWAHNSVVDAFHLRFPGGSKAIGVNGTPGGTIPSKVEIQRQWKDVVGVHLGGDYVAIPNRLAVRGGGWFETKGQDDKYLQLDFDLAEKIGLALGATVRLGPVDVSAAFQHTFIGTLDNKGKGAVHALSGDQGTPNFQSRQIVNGGKLTEEMNEGGVSGTLRF